jgi:hypothetical protein
MLKSILNELNNSNSSNYKLEVLKKYSNNEDFKRVLELTYDRVKYTFGVKKLLPYTLNTNGNTNLELIFSLLNKLNNRGITGNDALYEIKSVMEIISSDNAYILERILDRDLKCNFGTTLINKVFKNLITDIPYMRCGIYNDKTAKKINFPAIVQIKADGMYQAVTVDNGNVTFTSRSGEIREFPLLAKEFEVLPNGIYIGELLINNITNRSEANGLINSDEPPHKDIYIQLWDYLTLEEYSDPKHENNNVKRYTYIERFETLNSIINNLNNIKIIETKIVNNIQEALQITSEWMNNGLEGSILKDKENIFKDHTSPTQLKLKLEIEIDVRVTGFTEGTKGTKREKTFGAITFTNDEGTIMGQTSGFTDKQLEEFNNNREQLIGKVMTVLCNDITKGRDNDYYALSHPRFIEFRNDKDTTDTLERALQQKDSAMMLK